MLITEQIHKEVEQRSKKLDESFFGALNRVLNQNSFTNKETSKVKAIQKNLTKQIWSRFYLFKEKKKNQLKQKGLGVIIMDKKFFDEFMDMIDTEESIRKDVYEQVGNDIKKLNRLYSGYRSKKISDDEMIKRIKKNDKALTIIVSDVINAISLATTLKYINHFLDSDVENLPDGVLRTGIRSMRNATSSFSKSLFGAIGDEINRRSRK